MKISNRHRSTYSLAVFYALTSVFLILNGCGDDDDDGAVIPVRHSISGQVTLDNGSGLSSVTMTLSGASTATAITDASGNYTFTGLDNGSYTITPSKTGFTFGPTDNTQTVSGANKTGVNFTATPVQAGPYSISGQVISPDIFAGLSSVTMTLGGANTGMTTTDSGGFYTFTGLDNGIYTITPTRTGYTFSPTSSQQTVSGADITGVHFTATLVQAATHSISGQVTSNGSGLSDVTMTLSGARSDNVITNASGSYTFTGLDNGSYTVTPSKTGFTFSPTNSPQTVSGADKTGVNFTTTGGPSALIVVPCPLSVATNVTIQDNFFTPDNVTISVNEIVKWTNSGTTHTATSGTTPAQDGKFNSPSLGTGATFCVQFLGIGTAPYFCTIHPDMTGSVTVTGGDGDPCLGCWDY